MLDCLHPQHRSDIYVGWVRKLSLGKLCRATSLSFSLGEVSEMNARVQLFALAARMQLTYLEVPGRAIIPSKSSATQRRLAPEAAVCVLGDLCSQMLLIVGGYFIPKGNIP